MNFGPSSSLVTGTSSPSEPWGAQEVFSTDHAAIECRYVKGGAGTAHAWRAMGQGPRFVSVEAHSQAARGPE